MKINAAYYIERITAIYDQPEVISDCLKIHDIVNEIQTTPFIHYEINRKILIGKYKNLNNIFKKYPLAIKTVIKIK